MKFSVFIGSLILVNANFGMCQRPILKCPQYIYRLFASQTYCNSTHVSYICVKNMNDDNYMDICEKQPERSRAGRRVVWSGNLDTVQCQLNRYQPMIFNTNDTNDCVYIKSTCKEIGQFIANFGSTKDDVACGCDNAEGYTFIQRRKNNTCVPSFEDCSCYNSNLPKSDVLPNFLEVDNKNQVDNVLMSDRSRIISGSEGREKESAFTKNMQTLSRWIATVIFSIMAMCLLLMVETKRFQESPLFKLSIFSAMMTTEEKNTEKKLRKDSADSETKMTSVMMTTEEKNNRKKLRKDSADSETMMTSASEEEQIDNYEKRMIIVNKARSILDEPCCTHLVGGNKVLKDEISKMMGMSNIQGISEKCNHFDNEFGKLFDDATSQFTADFMMKEAQEMKNSLDHVEHIILLIIDFDNNSNTDIRTLQEYKKYLVETFENQIIVLFTHSCRNEGNETDDKWLKRHPNVREIFSEIFKNEKSYCIFNVKGNEREIDIQVKCLKALIESRTYRNVLQLL